METSFEGQPLLTDDRGFRIFHQKVSHPEVLVLGPSSAFGWGVRAEETWAQQISSAPVLNASQIGFSLFQGRRLFESLGPEDLGTIKTVILAYGVNDIDRFRFFGSDGSSDADHYSVPEKEASSLHQLFYSSALSALFVRASQELRLYTQCGASQVPALRLSLEDFENRLRDFIQILKLQKFQVVIANSAREMPFDANEEKAASVDSLFAQSARASKEGQCAESRRLFFAAKAAEPWRVLRDIDKLNMVIEKVGRELSVPVADLAGALTAKQKGELFVDPIHPSIKGHRLAAEVIKKAMQGKEISR